MSTSDVQGLGVTPVPPLWPLPAERFCAFSEVERIRFEWQTGSFRITRESAFRSHRLHTFPLTEEGWSLAWRVLTDQFPALAEDTGKRVAELRKTDRVRAGAAAAPEPAALSDSTTTPNAGVVRTLRLLAPLWLVVIGGTDFGLSWTSPRFGESVNGPALGVLAVGTALTIAGVGFSQWRRIGAASARRGWLIGLGGAALTLAACFWVLNTAEAQYRFEVSAESRMNSLASPCPQAVADLATRLQCPPTVCNGARGWIARRSLRAIDGWLPRRVVLPTPARAEGPDTAVRPS